MFRYGLSCTFLLLSAIFLLTPLACSNDRNGSPTPAPTPAPGFTPVPIPTFTHPFPTPVPTPTPPPSANMPAELRGQTAGETAQAIAAFVSLGKNQLLTVENAHISSSSVEYVQVDLQTGQIIGGIQKLPGIVLHYTIRLAKAGAIPSPSNADGMEILGSASDILRFTADHIVEPIYFSDNPRARAFQYLVITIIDRQGTPVAFAFTQWYLLEERAQLPHEKRNWFGHLNERFYGTIAYRGNIYMKVLITPYDGGE